MTQFIHRIILALSVCAAIAPGAGASDQAANKSEQMSRILKITQDRLSRVQNYQCTRVRQGIGYKGVVHPPHRAQIAYDHEGRARLRKLEGLNACTYVWDGAKTFEIHEDVQPNGAIVFSARIIPGKTTKVHDCLATWNNLRGGLVSFLTGETKDGVEIEEIDGGDYRVSTPLTNDVRIVYVLSREAGYTPVLQDFYRGDELFRRHEIKFEAVGPDIWFPAEIKISFYFGSEAGEPVLAGGSKTKFFNIRVNDPHFDELMAPVFPDGTEVRDEVSGWHYIAGQKSRLRLVTKEDDESVESAGDPSAWREAFDVVYCLDEGEVLKRIGPPFIPERKDYIISREPKPVRTSTEALCNTVLVFRWDNDLQSTYNAGNSFLPLSYVLDLALGVPSYECDGPAYLDEIRMPGDWIVRKDASREDLLRALEEIVREETGRSIAFVKKSVQSRIIRASGQYHFTPLNEEIRDGCVYMFAGAANTRLSRKAGGCSGGSLAGFLKDLGNRIGLPVINETAASDCLSWAYHESSELEKLKLDTSVFDAQLASLLDNLSRQTGLTFTIERGTIDQWRIVEAHQVATTLD